MGQRHSVILANVFMSFFFAEFFRAFPHWAANLPFFRRFLDDIFGFWNGTAMLFVCFVSHLNSWSKSQGYGIEFEITGFGAPLSFLDMEAYASSGSWQTRLYYKPTDLHAYLYELTHLFLAPFRFNSQE